MQTSKLVESACVYQKETVEKLKAPTWKPSSKQELLLCKRRKEVLYALSSSRANWLL